MKQLKNSPEHLLIFLNLLRWTLLVIPVAGVGGSLVALFLWLLDWAIHFRFAHSWLLFLLPLAGVVIYFLYKLWGKGSEAGNNLIMDEIHAPGGGVPFRMAPLVLITTVITHLFGGSAGREGTAVQIGGGGGGFFCSPFRVIVRGCQHDPQGGCGGRFWCGLRDTYHRGDLCIGGAGPGADKA